LNAVLVDTDILIEVLRARDRGILSEWRRLGGSEEPVLFAAVTAAELWHGARKQEEAAIQQLLSTLICVSVDAEIARRAGGHLRRFRASHGIELADALIAATAGIHECKLWTRNRKHYPMRDITLFR
jgi:predicted nucleic acid-binding protein